MSVDPPAHLSPTSWSKWDQCRRAWAFRYVDKVEDPPTVAKETGSFAHRVLELLFSPDRKPAERTIGAARSLAGDVWRFDYYGEPQTVALGLASEREFKAKAWNAVTGLWSVEDPTRVAVVATERRIEWQPQGVPMVVVVDRVERNSAGLLTIGDYKSGGHKPKYQAQPRRQVAIGAMAVASQEGAAEVGDRGKLLYVAAEKVVPADTTREVRVSLASQAEATWLAITEACETEDFPPTTGILCGWCPGLADCPEGLHAVERMRSAGWLKADAPGLAVLAAREAA